MDLLRYRWRASPPGTDCRRGESWLFSRSAFVLDATSWENSQADLRSVPLQQLDLDDDDEEVLIEVASEAVRLSLPFPPARSAPPKRARRARRVPLLS